MKLKGLITNDDKYDQLLERLEFYETECDVKAAIASFLNSPDIKAQVEAKGPYVFKELSNQDQMVLIKLQYEGRIKGLENTVERQQKELDRYRETTEDYKDGKITHNIWFNK